MADNRKSTAASFIDRVFVVKNKGRRTSRGTRGRKTVDVANGVVNLKYFESLLQDHVVMEVSFADSGGAIDNKSAVDGLPIENEAKVEVKIRDTKKNKLEFTNRRNNSFRVEKVTTIGDDATKTVATMQLVTYEAIKNNYASVEIRKDGKISEHVKRIFKDKKYLNTKKKLNIDDTANNLNYCFAKNKPFYVLNRISKDAVPQGADTNGGSLLGKSAGFLFYETYKGFYFKGIDSLFAQEPKKKIIFNNTPGETIPEGYDTKALTYQKQGTASQTAKLRGGAFNTKNIQFNPYKLEYKVDTLSSFDLEESLSLGGGEFPALNEEFQSGEPDDGTTRTTFIVNVPGTLVEGSGLGDGQEQLAKSEDFNFDAKSIMNQSIMRYNQFFQQKVSITIGGDFSLHAGDTVEFSTNQQGQPDKKSCGDDVDKYNGGKYVIATLCHYLTPDNTYTKLELVRDSVGKVETSA